MADTIRIRSTRPSAQELQVLVRIWMETFAGHTWRASHFPRGTETEDEEREWRVGWKLRALDNDPTNFYVVAHEEEKKTLPGGAVEEDIIIGWTSWNSVAEPGKEKSAEQKGREEVEEMGYRPDAMDKTEQERIRAGLKVVYKKCIGEGDARDYWILQVLCVHPSHQRKGVATRMVRWGIEEAARHGKGVIVIATPMGKPFYASVGFQTVAKMDIWGEAFPGMVIRPP
ncbi:hypothetical protein NKR19_g8010 [Coniochaeta hoffmannii]|uniref:N-acetyltransferase domain-containing protein n=1 Tax=Coniochaeta hoffmannii TaxID=91930 RepID=A0AA38RS98_9PEZI|nr:hypothetical protein NKR19_g8010 [Coniochaeta hoffmannii]